jgi:hypothetical protein
MVGVLHQHSGGHKKYSKQGRDMCGRLLSPREYVEGLRGIHLLRSPEKANQGIAQAFFNLKPFNPSRYP